MATSLARQISDCVQDASMLYHRLALVVGPRQSGKTQALRDLNAKEEWPLVNLNLKLSERLLELTVSQRRRRTDRIVAEIVESASDELVMVDNLEMLFHPELKQDPLRVLQGLSRNRIIVASWRGTYHDSTLIYASPSHPEYRRYEEPDALIICST